MLVLRCETGSQALPTGGKANWYLRQHIKQRHKLEEPQGRLPG